MTLAKPADALTPHPSLHVSTVHWGERKVHVTPSVDLYSGQILVFSMTLITLCVLSSV